MHKPAPVLENETHKLLWDFNIQTDPLIPARRPDLIIINKKKENLQNCRLCCPSGPQNKLLWDIQTDHLIPARRPDLIIINKRNRIRKIVDFAVPAHHRINLKESEKKDKYLNLVRELKKLWNMKVTIVPIVIGALGTVTKGLLKCWEDLEVGGRVETIQTTALLRTVRILRRVLET